MRVVIWGAAGHALVVEDILTLRGVDIAGFIDDVNVTRHGAAHGRERVLGGRDIIRGNVRVALGFGDCAGRLDVTSWLDAKGIAVETAIHPSATIAATSSVGAGTVVVAHAVVCVAAQIGRAVILNTSCSVDHECVIEDGAHIGPGARLGGLVHIERGAWIGMGAVVLDRVRIGAGSIVGAGAVVTRDIPAGVVAFGVPARVQRATHG